ncbi:MAG: hypothetical protein P1V20_00480 [Verrucomicrobiales bacterium]|nr:hypothetical protein [Verrucomicrobiales bacterium]
MLFFLCSCFAIAEEATALYRTDENNKQELQWYQLEGMNFPPPGTAHYIAGELIDIDHTGRKFVIRTDRTDEHRRSHFDLPLAAAMLPYGSIYYHGSPAALEDIPHGTHLHGWFYQKHPEDDSQPLESWHGRVTPEADFNRCFRLEDDFSFYRRSGCIWKVDKVDLHEMKLTATLWNDGDAVGEPTVFDLQTSTRVWQGNCVVDLQSVKKQQSILFNITWATLYGPGRIREIWLDEASRELAASHQTEKHILYQKQRGLAGRVDEVDNQKRLVTIRLFGGISDELLTGFVEGDEAGIAVATDALITYDPVNDRKKGPVISVQRTARAPGYSGVMLTIKPSLLLEGYRPGKIVRVYPSIWPVIALPMEEKYFGRY